MTALWDQLWDQMSADEMGRHLETEKKLSLKGKLVIWSVMLMVQQWELPLESM